MPARGPRCRGYNHAAAPRLVAVGWKYLVSFGQLVDAGLQMKSEFRRHGTLTAERRVAMTKLTLSMLSGTTLVILLGAASALGQKGLVVEKNVEFARGESSATVKGVVESPLDSHIFHIRARAGQTMVVQMISSRPLRDAYLCVNYPLTETGENEGVCKKRRYKIKLPRDGDYEIYIEAIRARIPYTITITVK